MPNGCPKSTVWVVLVPIVIKKLIKVACALGLAGETANASTRIDITIPNISFIRVQGGAPIQPQLQPALVKLSVALLIVVDHLRCRLAHFDLGTHFLDLGGLLFELGRQLRDNGFQFLNFAIEHGLLGGVWNGLRLDAWDGVRRH